LVSIIRVAQNDRKLVIWAKAWYDSHGGGWDSANSIEAFSEERKGFSLPCSGVASRLLLPLDAGSEASYLDESTLSIPVGWIWILVAYDFGRALRSFVD
jgi:hypothetical protein